jgi:hypothetical protein
MKKIFSFIFLFFTPLILSAQWFGDGLSALTAYYGVINTANPMQAWNLTNYPGGVIYVGRAAAGQNDLEVGAGGILTISQGITIKFCTTESDLRITGTGVLNASGSSTSLITFTKDAQDTWGHITFEASTGVSTIRYCIIEYGYKSGAAIEGYGGGIQANTDNLTISYTKFNNNYAQYGGALFVNASRHPVIYNCYVYNNQSLHGGGGFYFWNYSSSVVTNCIFESNRCLEPSTPYYTGGGVAGQLGVAIKIVNCTFVNNTSTRTEGQALLLHGSPNARVINSVFWGSSVKQIYCYTSTPASVVINCAFRGITFVSGAPLNPVILDQSNTGSGGPYFVATDGTDWSIKVISPCRDAGTNSFSGVAIPALDYLGNSTVVTKDIGAFEVQYNGWKTTASSTDWNTASNWNLGVPTSSENIVLPSGAANYPTGSSTLDYTIGSGFGMVLDPGARATLSTLTNNGDLRLRSDASNLSSLITGNNVTAMVDLYITGGGSPNYRWHYISVPVSNVDTNVFWSYTKDLARYISGRPSSGAMEGWVAADGYVYSNGSQDNQYAFNKLYLRTGYNYYRSADHKYTFSGQLNKDTVNAILAYKSGNNALYGFNLLGNPFSSGLNWDDIADSIYYSYPANTSRGLYFTKDNAQCSYVNGVGTPLGTTGIIPPMQGFFVKTNGAGNILRIPVEARTHTSIHSRYKGKTLIPLVRLAVSRDSVFDHFPVFKDSVLTDTGYVYSVLIDSIAFNHVNSDDAVVRFDDHAKSDLDNDFDALKMFLTTDLPYIYSSAGGVKYSINGIPFPVTTVDIPIVVYFTTSGNHKISTIELQGLDDYNVRLFDNVTGFTSDLKTNPNVVFTASSGVLSDRFVLKVSKVLTGIEDVHKTDNMFKIYSSEGELNVTPLNDEWSGKSTTINIFDLTGKKVITAGNVWLQNNSETSIAAPVKTGIYVVEITAGALRYSGKVAIR